MFSITMPLKQVYHLGFVNLPKIYFVDVNLWLSFEAVKMIFVVVFSFLNSFGFVAVVAAKLIIITYFVKYHSFTVLPTLGILAGSVCWWIQLFSAASAARRESGLTLLHFLTLGSFSCASIRINSLVAFWLSKLTLLPPF